MYIFTYMNHNCSTALKEFVYCL